MHSNLLHIIFRLSDNLYTLSLQFSSKKITNKKVVIRLLDCNFTVKQSSSRLDISGQIVTHIAYQCIRRR